MKFQLKPSLKLKPFEGMEHFQQGVDENRVTEPLIYYRLEQLKQRGWLLYHTPELTLEPFDETFCYAPAQGKSYHLSRFVICRPDKEGFVLETPLSAARVHLHDLAFLQNCDGPSEARSLLVSARMLVDQPESEELTQWETHDLYFHTRSRKGRNSAPYGAHYPYRDTIAPLPAIKQCPHQKIPLRTPTHIASRPLQEVLENRQSIRSYDTQATLTLEHLSAFLYRSARVKKVIDVKQDQVSQRLYPGGGARYELEIYPVVHQLDGLTQGVYHYHPLDHALCSVGGYTDETKQLLVDAQHSTGLTELPPILFVIAARFQRVSWKYRSMAYALVLKNVGILIQTMYLVAADMGLAPCAVGGGDSDLFCRVSGTNYLEETSVGEFILGPQPAGQMA